MTHTLSPATVQVVHGIVAAIFTSALRDRLVSTSPCEGTKLPKKVLVEIRPLSTATTHQQGHDHMPGGSTTAPARSRSVTVPERAFVHPLGMVCR